MSRALITGVNGFTGRHLARFLSAQGLDVFGITRSESNLGLSDPVDGRLRLIRADLLDRVAVTAIVAEVSPDYIFHLASDRRPADLTELVSRNIGATYNVLQAALRLPRTLRVKVLVVGSAAEYGAPGPQVTAFSERHPLAPVSAYGVMKVAEVNLAYSYLATYGLATYTARTFNLVGPGEPTTLVCSALASQVAAIEAGRQEPVLRVGPLGAERDFVDIRDAVGAYWAIVTQGEPGQPYNVCTGNGRSIGMILNMVRGLAHVPVGYRVDSGRSSSNVAVRCVGDPTRIGREIGWSPAVPFERSLVDLVEDWRRRYRDEAVSAPLLSRTTRDIAMEVGVR